MRNGNIILINKKGGYNKMKNFFIMAICIMAVMVAIPVFAGTNLTGTNATITDTNGGGSGLTGISLSPNVTLNYNGASTSFEMCGVNSNGNLEYGVYSGTNRIYQHAATITNNTANVTNITTTDGSTVTGWTTLGE